MRYLLPAIRTGLATAALALAAGGAHGSGAAPPAALGDGATRPVDASSSPRTTSSSAEPHAPTLVAGALRGSLEAERRRLGVPGAALAYIDDCRLAWELGLGSTRRWGGSAVAGETVFPAASLGKPIGALAVLHAARTVGQATEAPLGATGIVPADVAAQVSLLHLLSHTSSLSNRVWPPDRTLHGAPGDTFTYSGMGYLIAQQWATARTARDAQRLAQDAVFAPLGMTRSSFTHAPRGVAHGHTAAGLLAAMATPIVLPLFLVFAAAVGTWYRVRRRRWTAPAMHAAAALGLAGVSAAGVLAAPLGGGTAILAATSSVALMLLVGGLAWALARGGQGRARILRGVLGAIVGAAAGAALAVVQVPLPVPADVAPQYAYTLRTTAPDLARLAMALLRPPPALASEIETMTTPAVSLERGYGWAHGIGTRQFPDGRRVWWQWGSNPGYRSLLVVEPATCRGLVVLTNADRGAEFAETATREILGLPGPWRAVGLATVGRP